MRRPNQKNLLLIVASLIVIGGIFAFKEYKNTSNEQTIQVESTTATSTSYIPEEILIKDTDGDGLKDWEEALWGTDPRNPDTDGDKTNDGDEVKKSRNPLVKGPKDTLAQTATSTKNSDPSKNLTLTDQFSRDLFAKYMTLRQAGQASDAQSQADLIDEMLMNNKYTLKSRVYVTKEIKTRQDDSVASIRQYGNDVGRVFKTYMISSKNEALIVKDSTVSGNQNELAQLDPIIKSYQNILDNLLKIQVPESAVYIHLKILNSTSELIFADQALRKFYTDPMLGLLGLTQYQTSTQSFFDAIKDIKSFLNQKVTYTSTETGSLFN